jgi:hypothetical protein
MTIDWGALAVVAVVSLAVGVLVVALVSLALVGLSAREPDPSGDVADGTPPDDGRQSRLSSAAGTATAAICLLGAAAIVLYGLFLIVN